MPKDLPSPELLCKLLRYDGCSGKLFWRSRTNDMFSSNGLMASQRCRAWNTRYCNRPAFDSNDQFGYKRGQVMGKFLRAHRVIWAMETGAWPSDQIDHINGDRADNRMFNLRDVNISENGRNRAISSANTSGVCGVIWNKGGSRWVAHIHSGGRRLYLGSSESFSTMASVRKSAEAEFGYQPRHGTKNRYTPAHSKPQG